MIGIVTAAPAVLPAPLDQRRLLHCNIGVSATGLKRDCGPGSAPRRPAPAPCPQSMDPGHAPSPDQGLVEAGARVQPVPVDALVRAPRPPVFPLQEARRTRAGSGGGPTSRSTSSAPPYAPKPVAPTIQA